MSGSRWLLAIVACVCFQGCLVGGVGAGTRTPTFTPTFTPTLTLTQSPTLSFSSSLSATPTLSQSLTPSMSLSVSTTFTLPTATASITPTLPTATVTMTATSTASQTLPTATLTPSLTILTPSATLSVTARSVTQSVTVSSTLSGTATLRTATETTTLHTLGAGVVCYRSVTPAQCSADNSSCVWNEETQLCGVQCDRYPSSASCRDHPLCTWGSNTGGCTAECSRVTDRQGCFQLRGCHYDDTVGTCGLSCENLDEASCTRADNSKLCTWRTKVSPNTCSMRCTDYTQQTCAEQYDCTWNADDGACGYATPDEDDDCWQFKKITDPTCPLMWIIIGILALLLCLLLWCCCRDSNDNTNEKSPEYAAIFTEPKETPEPVKPQELQYDEEKPQPEYVAYQTPEPAQATPAQPPAEPHPQQLQPQDPQVADPPAHITLTPELTRTATYGLGMGMGRGSVYRPPVESSVIPELYDRLPDEHQPRQTSPRRSAAELPADEVERPTFNQLTPAFVAPASYGFGGPPPPPAGRGRSPVGSVAPYHSPQQQYGASQYYSPQHGADPYAPNAQPQELPPPASLFMVI
eukprot:TRINITY_DN7630_c1_g1_i1.p1 TRINITY_DN7630_c1_g1~~TRINITY_DN7630_c1_g1_i1.p1  ORF type:complete len:596 (+),score=83.67 TRINITY_DN7630_c1_g1_i1:53-1789(+)